MEFDETIEQILAWLILSVVLCCVSTMLLVIAHENVHKEIFRSYDMNSTITIKWLSMEGLTTATSNFENCEIGSNCNLAHNLNEIVGYHLHVLILIIMVIFSYRIVKDIFNNCNSKTYMIKHIYE